MEKILLLCYNTMNDSADLPSAGSNKLTYQKEGDKKEDGKEVRVPLLGRQQGHA